MSINNRTLTPEERAAENKPSERISVTEAAKIMDVSPSYIRMGIRCGRLPFGTAVKMSSQWTYHISRAAFEQYLAHGIRVAN